MTEEKQPDTSCEVHPRKKRIQSPQFWIVSLVVVTTILVTLTSLRYNGRLPSLLDILFFDLLVGGCGACIYLLRKDADKILEEAQRERALKKKQKAEKADKE